MSKPITWEDCKNKEFKVPPNGFSEHEKKQILIEMEYDVASFEKEFTNGELETCVFRFASYLIKMHTGFTNVHPYTNKAIDFWFRLEKCRDSMTKPHA